MFRGFIIFISILFYMSDANGQSPDERQSKYPRPQMVRSNWINLNGVWDYLVFSNQEPAIEHDSFSGKIMVPFAIESKLSAVTKSLLPRHILWYKRKLPILRYKKNEKVLFHFGAVDQECVIFLNGKKVSQHSGGFDAFSFDITSFLIKGENELSVSVTDNTESGVHPHGKQTLKPMWTRYTAVSGIWQTVWLEVVPKVYIESLKMVPDIDKGLLSLKVNTNSNLEAYMIEAVSEKGIIATGKANAAFEVKVPNAHLWSPEDPYLYNLSIRLKYKGKIVDTVGSYFGMRKVDIQNDAKGIERIFLNNKPYFNLGLLDQGYWPDGLYTAPNDEALKYDVEIAKKMGFNTIRKHVKIEPARWYYHCDKIGMLVWQDMPSWRGFRTVPDGEKKNFESEAKAHINDLYNYPSIIMWCMFNEDWGVFDQQRMADAIAPLDPTRIFNANSGSFKDDHTGSQVTDRHMYPGPTLPPYEAGKAMLCGEFGGVYQGVEGHEWLAGKGWGHPSPPSFSLLQRYAQMAKHVEILKEEGLSGAIYTQPYDVETEENGLYTYDRKVFKVPVDSIRKINQRILKDNK